MICAVNYNQCDNIVVEPYIIYLFNITFTFYKKQLDQQNID